MAEMDRVPGTPAPSAIPPTPVPLTPATPSGIKSKLSSDLDDSTTDGSEVERAISKAALSIAELSSFAGFYA